MAISRTDWSQDRVPPARRENQEAHLQYPHQQDDRGRRRDPRRAHLGHLGDDLSRADIKVRGKEPCLCVAATGVYIYVQIAHYVSRPAVSPEVRWECVCCPLLAELARKSLQSVISVLFVTVTAARPSALRQNGEAWEKSVENRGRGVRASIFKYPCSTWECLSMQICLWGHLLYLGQSELFQSVIGDMSEKSYTVIGTVRTCLVNHQKYVCEVIYCTWDSHNLLGQSQEICLRGHILSIPLISEKSRDMTNKAGYGHSIYHIGV